MSVIPFQRPALKPAPEDKAGWLSCPARCMSCMHEWVAVLPSSQPPGILECDACHAVKGILTSFVMDKNADAWTCTSCEGVLFSILLRTSSPETCCATCGRMSLLIECFDGVPK